ncbi:MAG: hypothetical protein HY897_24065 [Deltaproteobacteria bacterium]|nr:hypothetical protein [Deltaproteobacteria bacterium]
MRSPMALFLLVLCAATFFLPACTDRCKDAADEIASCHEKFCALYGQSTDRARMDCQNWDLVCPNGEAAICGLDMNKCEHDDSLADPFLDGECDETTGQITTGSEPAENP